VDIETENDLMAILKLQPVFGKNANLVMAYIEIFQIAPMGKHLKKIRLLLTEMATLFQAEAFSFQKKTYKITQTGIAEALNIVAHRHFEMPLDNHNYLKKIMIGISEREAQGAGKQAERELRRKEERIMAGDRIPDEATRQGNLTRVGEIIKILGG
jgi:hypothetical protein